MLLGRRLSTAQWAACVLLTVSVAVVEQAGSHQTSSTPTKAPASISAGLAAVLLSVIISGFGTTFLEGTLKQSDTASALQSSLAVRRQTEYLADRAGAQHPAVSLRQRNCARAGCHERRPDRLLHVLWRHSLVDMRSAGSGRLPGRVGAQARRQRRCVSIATKIDLTCSAKSFATALGLVSSAVLSATWLGYAPSPMLLLGVAGVLAGTLLYVRASGVPSAPPKPDEKPPASRSPLALGRRWHGGALICVLVAIGYAARRGGAEWARRATVAFDMARCGHSPCQFLLIAGTDAEVLSRSSALS